MRKKNQSARDAEVHNQVSFHVCTKVQQYTKINKNDKREMTQ